MLGGKSPYSTSNVESSTTSWMGSSLGTSQEQSSQEAHLVRYSCWPWWQRLLLLIKRLLKWGVQGSLVMAFKLPPLWMWRRKTFKLPPLWTSLRFRIEGSLVMANLKVISICCKGLIHLLQKRLTTNKEALPSSNLYQSSKWKTW